MGISGTAYNELMRKWKTNEAIGASAGHEDSYIPFLDVFKTSSRFIRFVHVPKTAGVTILKSLKKSVREDGEVTADFKVTGHRWKIIGGKDSYHDRSSYCGGFIIFPHEVEDEFLFSFVRNPWDRFVSAYCYLTEIKSNEYVKWIKPFESFESFVKKGSIESLHFKPQTYWINTEVDFIGHFENLQNDFDSLCDKLKLPHQTLGYENKTNHKPYWEYYNDETEVIIGEKYAKDIEKFGYKFK